MNFTVNTTAQTENVNSANVFKCFYLFEMSGSILKFLLLAFEFGECYVLFPEFEQCNNVHNSVQ